MSQTIIEYLREQAVSQLFDLQGVENSWPTWREEIELYAPQLSARQVFNLGDNLRSIFTSTRDEKGNRSQSEVSVGGTSWEALVCWYLNLCLVGRRTIVLRHNKKLIPSCISDAITVSYESTPSNTESDLIAINYPDKPEYESDKDAIHVSGKDGEPIKTYKTSRSRYNLQEVLESLTIRDFSDIEVHIIQCKTNWNDNAQIPMLWDAVYSAESFNNNTTVGINGYSIKDVKRFTYSFVTVPTVKIDKFTVTSLPVIRVRSLSGGNYWGLPSKSNIALSVKEMLNSKLKHGHSESHINTIDAFLPELHTTYEYFGL